MTVWTSRLPSMRSSVSLVLPLVKLPPSMLTRVGRLPTWLGEKALKKTSKSLGFTMLGEYSATDINEQ